MNAVEYYNYIVLQRMKINKMLTVGQIKKILYIKLVEGILAIFLLLQ